VPTFGIRPVPTSAAFGIRPVPTFGIRPVPTFVVDRSLGVSGAHPPEALVWIARHALR
jgi:predicted DsbA family dithiol-disulfide isomerase